MEVNFKNRINLHFGLWTEEIGELGNYRNFFRFLQKVINYMFYFINKNYSIGYQ